MRFRKAIAWCWLGVILAGWISMMTLDFYILMGPWGLLAATLLVGFACASGYIIAVWLD